MASKASQPSQPEAKRSRTETNETLNFQDIAALLGSNNAPAHAASHGSSDAFDLEQSESESDASGGSSETGLTSSTSSSDAEPEVPSSSQASSHKGVCATQPMKVAEEAVQQPWMVEEEQKVSHMVRNREIRLQQAAASKPQGKVFCNANLGLVDSGMQIASKLACCRHCLVKIQKGSPRFAFAYSLTKFHAWLHEACVGARGRLAPSFGVVYMGIVFSQRSCAASLTRECAHRGLGHTGLGQRGLGHRGLGHTGLGHRGFGNRGF